MWIAAIDSEFGRVLGADEAAIEDGLPSLGISDQVIELLVHNNKIVTGHDVIV